MNFLIVLDINNTLLFKIKKDDTTTLEKIVMNNKEPLFKTTHFYLLKRPFTELFIRFLHTHDLQYVIWSTALKKNVEKMLIYLKQLGYKFVGYLGQEECEEGDAPGMKTKKHIKNLKIVSERFRKPLEECILIDDSKEKAVEGQNYINIKEMNVFERDEELIRVGYELDKLIKCKEECEIKREYKKSIYNKK